MSRQRGTVKWFSRDKGWGFIRLEGGDEIFVHHSDVEGEGFVNLEDDEPVEFTIEDMEKGPRARNVRSLAGGAAATAGPGPRTARAEQRERDEPRERRPRAGDHDPSSEGGRKPLAEQLMERLGRRFPGLRG